MPDGEKRSESQTQVLTKARPLAKAGFGFLPQTWEQLYNFAKEISQTDFAPKDMRNKPGAVLAAWQKGQEVGLGPMAALQSICIINGRPSIHSAGYWSIIVNHPLCEEFSELAPHEALEKGYGECTIRRRGLKQPVTRRFTMEEAKKAELINKDNWKHYPGDMLMHRARHRAGDAAIPEAAQGLLPATTAEDLDAIDVTPPEEPLKTPQAIGGPDAAKGEGGPVQEAGMNGQEVEVTGSDSVDDIGDSGGSEATTTTDAPTEQTPPATQAETVKPETGRKPADPLSKKDELIKWVNEEATNEEILARENKLTEDIKELNSKDQIEAVRAWNAKRKEVLAEREKK